LDSCPRIETPRFIGKNAAKDEADFAEIRSQMKKRLPSPSANVSQKSLFTLDILIPVKNDTRKNNRDVKQCPAVALYN
jgi:hypothetical protein